MEIRVDDLYELKLLVECVDLERISQNESYVPGWGTAGVIVDNKVTNTKYLLPVGSDGRSGSIMSPGDKIIITPYVKPFAWFLDVLLKAAFVEPNPVALFEQVPFYHSMFCATKMGRPDYDFKEELLYICDSLIKAFGLEERANNYSCEESLQHIEEPEVDYASSSQEAIRIGSTVRVWDYNRKEESQYKILPSADQIRYTTMGYRTRNYAEITRVSDADGVNSVGADSPLGQALLDKTVGEEITYYVDDNYNHYKILLVINPDE